MASIGPSHAIEGAIILSLDCRLDGTHGNVLWSGNRPRWPNPERRVEVGRAKLDYDAVLDRMMPMDELRPLLLGFEVVIRFIPSSQAERMVRIIYDPTTGSTIHYHVAAKIMHHELEVHYPDGVSEGELRTVLRSVRVQRTAVSTSSEVIRRWRSELLESRALSS